jgi:hypothetical protein
VQLGCCGALGPELEDLVQCNSATSVLPGAHVRGPSAAPGHGADPDGGLSSSTWCI